MIPIMLATMLNPLNSSLILTALVPIGNEFGVGPLQTGWLIGGLYLSSAVSQTPLGRVVDLLGARRVLIAGLGVAVLASCIGAFASTLDALIAARILLGVGTSAAFPSAMSIVRGMSEGAPIPTGALSLITIAVQISTAIGPALSGALVVLFGWRSTQLVNVPIGIAALTMVLLWIPDDRRAVAGGWRGVLARIDVPGILLFALALTAVMLFSNAALPHVATAALALVAGAGFVARELLCAQPFLDLRLIARTRGFDRTIARQACVMIVIYALFYGVAEWLEDARRVAPSVVGLVMIPVALVAMGSAATLARRLAPRTALVIGSFSGAAGCAMLLLRPHDLLLVWVAAALGVSGLMNGLNGVANQAALYAQAPAGHVGVASGFFRSMQYVGAMFSAVLMGLVFGERADDAGFTRMMTIAGAVGVVLALAALADRTIPERGARVSSPPAPR
jgi:MFS family permease